MGGGRTYGDEVELGTAEFPRLALEDGADGLHLGGEALLGGLLVVNVDGSLADIDAYDVLHVRAQGERDVACPPPSQCQRCTRLLKWGLGIGMWTYRYRTRSPSLRCVPCQRGLGRSCASSR